MKTIVNGRIRDDIDHEKVFSALTEKWRRAGGLTGQILTASSAASIVRAVATDSQELLHSPGVNGLPGGYAVRVGENGGKIVLPEGVELEETIKVNEEGNRYDGIEKILDDGTVIYTEKEMSIMKEMIGYECKKMRVEECEERADEIRSKFQEFASKYR